jgi:hypothetical protein
VRRYEPITCQYASSTTRILYSSHLHCTQLTTHTYFRFICLIRIIINAHLALNLFLLQGLNQLPSFCPTSFKHALHSERTCISDLGTQALFRNVLTYLTAGIARLVQRPATGWTTDFLFPAGVRYFSLLHSVQTGCGAHLVSSLMDTGGCFPGSETDHSPPSSAEVTNGGGIPPFLLPLLGVVLN